ncbi:MAG TPA: 50S ribosomal protein L17 [Patescibacteria group bacterium]|nr:50S ribosomal protein L17 [Patescibacteria group bacterium]
MRHNKDWRKLNRTASHRRAMLRNMVTSLFAAERIRTTTPKAKEARRVAERMITFARRGDLSARRHVAKVVNDPAVLQKLFAEIGPRYVGRPGGYTRILKIGVRHGDAAQTAILELVGADEEGRKKKKTARKKRQKVEVPERPVVAKDTSKATEAGEAVAEEVTEETVEEAAGETAGAAAGTEAPDEEKPSEAEATAEAAGEGKPGTGSEKEPDKGGKK